MITMSLISIVATLFSSKIVRKEEQVYTNKQAWNGLRELIVRKYLAEENDSQ